MPEDNRRISVQSKHSTRRNVLKIAAAGSGIGIGALAGCLGRSDDEEMTVFFMIPDQDVTRWEERDFPAFEQEINEQRSSWRVESRDAGGSQSTQLSQVEDAVTQGADVIVLIAAAPSEAGGTLEVAAEDDIPIILHERGGFGGPAAGRVAYDAYASGVEEGEAALDVIDQLLQSQETVNILRLWGIQGSDWAEDIKMGQNEVIQPYLDDGRIEVLEGRYTGWGEEEARNFVEDSFTRFGDDIDMVLASNDGQSNGTAQALSAQGLSPGDIPIAGGQDATLGGVQLILQGWLHATYYKSIPDLSAVSAQLAIAAAEGETLPNDFINETYDNGYTEIPMAALTGQNVVRENIEVLVDEGVFTWGEMCQGIEEIDVCSENIS